VDREFKTVEPPFVPLDSAAGVAASNRSTVPRRMLGQRVKEAARASGTALRRANASRRPLPEFLILGTQKGGTTSLHEYLCRHPQVSPSTSKEVHYFDLAYDRGEGWYRAHFHPRRNPGEITGESSPYYLFHPRAPQRVAADLPGVKLIVILRNPVDRAFSHHNHEVALGFEQLSFEDALAAEPVRLAGEEERLLADPRYSSFPHRHYAYLERSRYAGQLERWFRHFDRDRFLVLDSEELFVEPAATVAAAQRFLGLRPEVPGDLSPRNARSYAPIAPPTRERLRNRFAADNERLYELVGRDFGWA
jgi:hypothetical protein